MLEELLQCLPVWGYGEEGMTQRDIARDIANEAGIDYDEAKRNLEELYRKRLVR